MPYLSVAMADTLLDLNHKSGECQKGNVQKGGTAPFCERRNRTPKGRSGVKEENGGNHCNRHPSAIILKKMAAYCFTKGRRHRSRPIPWSALYRFIPAKVCHNRGGVKAESLRLGHPRSLDGPSSKVRAEY